MKIALVRKEYTRSWGGAEGYVVNLSTQLCDMGHEVHVFANRWDEHSEPRIRFHYVPLCSLSSPLKNLSFALNARHLLRGEEFDMVSGFSQLYPQDVYRLGDGLHRHFLSIRYPAHTTRVLHCLNPRHLVILFIEKQIFNPHHFHQLIANSELCKRQVQHYYQVPEDRIEVIYNGVELERFNPGVRERFRSAVRSTLRISEKETVILFVSRNYKRKGLHSLIEGLALLGKKASAIKIVVVGRGNPKPYQRLAQRCGLTHTLRFAGEQRSIEHYYGASDVLVLPTFYDPFSNVCLEALACGLPVITTRSNGAAEIIEDGKSGFTIESASEVHALAEKIDHLLRPSVRKEMELYASQSVQKYTIAENARKTMALYEKVLARKKMLASSSYQGITVTNEYRALLTHNNLIDFNSLMYCEHGNLIKQVSKDRSTVRLALKDRGGEIGAYLKRYYTSGGKALMVALLKLSLPKTARDEWKNIIAFHMRNIPTVIPLSVGVRGHVLVKKESFLLTKAIEAVERLEDYLSHHFTLPLNSHQRREKWMLIREVAALVRRMHLVGFNHRDLYLCHLLVEKDSYPHWKIYFADLHRVDQRARVGERWRVKDLAALNYSADEVLITRTDRVRFLTHYLGGGRLDTHAKQLIKKIINKTEAIRSHDLKLQTKRVATRTAEHTSLMRGILL